MQENILNQRLRLTESQLATYWDMKLSTLKKWRYAGIGPVYIKIGARVIYTREAILEYEQNRTFRSFGDKIGGGKDGKR